MPMIPMPVRLFWGHANDGINVDLVVLFLGVISFNRHIIFAGFHQIFRCSRKDPVL
jgi:hypothetical protein